MHRWILTGTAAVAMVLLLGTAATAATPHDGVWMNGNTHTLVTGPPPANAGTPVPLYVISPIRPSHPLHALADAKLHGFGAHDHVIGWMRSGACVLSLVVPGPSAVPGTNVLVSPTATPAGIKPLANRAVLGGTMKTLTSAARIQSAAKLGLVTIVDTQVVLGCTVSK
jgi:hypothetical protein